VHDIDTLIIGAGVLGLAIARSLAMNGHEVLVVEQHDTIGSETSARNSEVIHAGIYYPSNSLKARLCVQGKMLLYDHCESHGVPFQRIGKLIVASDQSQIQSLSSIKDHAVNNGVNDLHHLGQTALRNLEPQLGALAGLFSPSTGIIDSHAFMLSLQGEAESHGCQIAFNTVADIWHHLETGGFKVHCTGSEPIDISARNLIVSAGLHSSNFLVRSDNEHSLPQTRFAKGNYFRLTGKVPFSHLIYPVPEPGGLGVHLTLDMGGQARFGPDVEWVDTLDYEVDPHRSEQFYSAIRSYWPGLPDGSLEPDYSGIRPKLSGPGDPNADFEFWAPENHGMPGLVGLLGMESPGLTASLAIAEYVRGLLQI
jgi:L-2-hydroxyglutarate oxidase LhgO